MSKGWLTNPERRKRRDEAFTFTDKDCEKLLNIIDGMEHYISSIFGSRLDALMRARDTAIICTNWIFFKRGNEVLKLQRKDVIVTDTEVLVTFRIQKKRKRFKLCPSCDERNGFKSKYCRKCSRNLQDVEVSVTGGEVIVTKRKVLRHQFVKYLLQWVEMFDVLTESATDRDEYCLFPPLRVRFSSAIFDFHSPMTIQNLDRILQKLDPTVTSCLFRYGGSEKYLSLGYSPHDLKEIGDWESSYMPELYAKRKGITPTQRKWAEDTR